MCLPVGVKPGEPTPEACAREFPRPQVLASVTLANMYGDAHEVDVGKLIDTLVAETEKVEKGDLRRMESLLVVQAHTLDAMFHRMLRNAWSSQWVDHFKMGLRAQAQCARTIEVLVALKYPQTPQFIRQQNVAGFQQVNNGATLGSAARAGEENLISPNELLERKDGQRLDSCAVPAAVGADPPMETVGEVHRTEDTDGKGARVEERVQREGASGIAGPGEGDAGPVAQPREHRARSRVKQESRKGA